MTVVDSRRVRAYAGRRFGTVYCYRTWRPDHGGRPTGIAEVGYVGQTVQQLAVRDGQHRGTARGPYGAAPQCQPWSDIVVGEVSIVEQGMWRCDELLERELYHIRRLRPRYNHAGNLANPDRVPVPEARRQRQFRDQARGAVMTTWPPAGSTTPRAQSRAQSRVPTRIPSRAPSRASTRAPSRVPTRASSGASTRITQRITQRITRRIPSRAPSRRPGPIARRVSTRVARRAAARAVVAALVTVAILVLGPAAHLPWRLVLVGTAAAVVSPLTALPRRRGGRRLAAAAIAVAAVLLLAG